MSEVPRRGIVDRYPSQLTPNTILGMSVQIMLDAGELGDFMCDGGPETLLKLRPLQLLDAPDKPEMIGSPSQVCVRRTLSCAGSLLPPS